MAGEIMASALIQVKFGVFPILKVVTFTLFPFRISK